MTKIKAQLQSGRDVIITSGLLKAIPEKIAEVCELRCSDLKALVNDFGRYGQSSREILIPQVRYQTNDSWEVVSAGRPLTGGVSGFPILHKAKYTGAYLYVLTIPDDMGQLYDYPAAALTEIRRVMSQDLVCEPNRFKLLTNLEDKSTVEGKLEDYWVGWHKKSATKFAVSLKPHSYMAFSY